MSGAKWIARPEAWPRTRRALARSEPPAGRVRVFLDERALHRWLTQGEPESAPRAPSDRPENWRSQAGGQTASAASETFAPGVGSVEKD